MSALDAANVLQVCSKPGQCTKIVRYPLKVRIGFECPPFAKQCTFYNTTQPASTSSRVAAAKPVNELQVFQYPKIVGSQVRDGPQEFTYVLGVGYSSCHLPSLCQQQQQHREQHCLLRWSIQKPPKNISSTCLMFRSAS